MANTHYVSRSDFAADLRDQDSTLSDAEIDQRYETFLDDVEQSQHVQARDLRRLIRETGCRAVFVEGVTPENLAWFKGKAAELRDVDFDKLQRQLENAEDAAEIATLIVTIDYYRDVRLDLGAAGRLMTTGEPIDVLPLDDSELLAAADPCEPMAACHSTPKQTSGGKTRW